ncbi:MAG TPA: tetratricopeptide repeat protein [Nitrososphaera sp.]|nr:tetratricopeptide repeat protein [Nitrososphaera sp.]
MAKHARASKPGHHVEETDYRGPAELLNRQGMGHAKKGEYNEAVKCFIKAQNVNPNNATSWYNIGTSLAMDNKEDKALFILYCYDRAIELNPQDAEAWNNKATILELMGADENAIMCYKRALEIRPGHGSAMRNMELLLTRLGRKREAMNYNTDSAQPKPSFTEAVHYVSWD